MALGLFYTEPQSALIFLRYSLEIYRMDSEPLPLDNKSPLSMFFAYVVQTVWYLAVSSLGIQKINKKLYIKSSNINKYSSDCR